MRKEAIKSGPKDKRTKEERKIKEMRTKRTR